MSLQQIRGKLIVQKNQYNKHGKFNYRSSEDILLALKPLLVLYECNITITDDIQLVGEYVYIKSTVGITDKDGKVFTSSSFARDAIEQRGMSAAMVTNSASSFAKKAALQNLFLIDDSADTVPTKEEQDEILAEQKKEAQQAKEKAEETLFSLCRRADKHISGAGSKGELKGIYANYYREAQALKDKDLLNAIVSSYQQRDWEIDCGYIY